MSEPETIALMLGGPEPELMPVEEAKALYAQLESKRESGAELNEDELSYHAALTLSLGTVFDLERVKRDWIAAGGTWK